MSFMVAEEFTTWPIVRYFHRLIECIPVKRDGRDTTATKQAIRHLRGGKALCIFIEGRIIPPWETGEPKDGVAMLALKTGAPVIPTHISGVTYHHGIVRGLIARHRTRVRFGPPVDLSEFQTTDRSRENTRAATRKIYAEINALALQEPAST
jgi:1-acyl-sn-glycerol-3-phosphate acyltransferase